MMKIGPCAHCGINSTPLWRKGPDEKPVLCNACGSRFKARGTLDNYLPKIVQNAQLLELNIQETCENNLMVKTEEAECENDFELSNSFSSGEINRNLWNTEIPQRNYPFEMREMTPMEKFHKQLLNMCECEKQSNELSEDNILLYDNVNNFIPRDEIGLGCTLLKANGTSSDQNHSQG